MTRAEKVKAELERANKASKWGERLKLLEKRGKEPLTQKAFCDKYGISGRFSPNKNGKTIPNQETVDKVEDALAAESV